MKAIKTLSLVLLLLAFTFSVKAQEPTQQTKPYVVHTMYLHASQPAMMGKIDSLLKIWKERVMDPNPYFTSTKIVRHWWGHDSREVIFIYELKSWNDIETAFEKRNEIIKAHKGWASEEDVKAFRKMWSEIFMPEHHSDEIYSVVAE